MQCSSKTSKICTKELKQSEPVSRNKNNDTAMPPKQKEMCCDYLKEHMQQRQQDMQYHKNKVKWNKKAKQEENTIQMKQA